MDTYVKERKHSLRCEKSLNKRCKCRCGGAKHGVLHQHPLEFPAMSASVQSVGGVEGITVRISTVIPFIDDDIQHLLRTVLKYCPSNSKLYFNDVLVIERKVINNDQERIN